MIQDGIHHDHTSNILKYVRKKSVVKSDNRKCCACRNLASSASFRPPPKGRGAKKRAARRKTLPASATLKTVWDYSLQWWHFLLIRGSGDESLHCYVSSCFFLTQTRTGIQSNSVMRRMPRVRAQSVSHATLPTAPSCFTTTTAAATATTTRRRRRSDYTGCALPCYHVNTTGVLMLVNPFYNFLPGHPEDLPTKRSTGQKGHWEMNGCKTEEAMSTGSSGKNWYDANLPFSRWVWQSASWRSRLVHTAGFIRALWFLPIAHFNFNWC